MSLNIVTTSFFDSILHTGKVYSVAIKQPKNFSFAIAPMFYPSWSLVLFWKAKVKGFRENKFSLADIDLFWGQYTKEYTHLLKERKEAIASWFAEQENVVTLVCHEKSNIDIPNCHRNILGAWLEKEMGCKHFQERLPPQKKQYTIQNNK